MNRKQVYIEAFEKATMERKIKSVKALEAYGQLDYHYAKISLHIDSIAEVLESVYPGKWDIILKRRRDYRYDDNDQQEYFSPAEMPFTLEIVIHFPSINITNTKKEEHTITDLYIKLEPHTGGDFSFRNFSGKRMSASNDEIYNRYHHSHLQAKEYKVKEERNHDNGGFYYRFFCLGSSEINQVMTMLQYNYKADIFRLFLMQLEEYLNWESIEGTPHIYMSNVLGGNASGDLGHNRLTDYYNQLKERTPQKEVDFILEGSLIRIIDNEKFEDFLRLWTDHNAYNSNIICRKDTKGGYYKFRYYARTITTSHLSSEEDRKAIGFMFRGERIDFRIVEIENENANITFYIHKQIKEYVKDTIEERIQSARFRDHISKSLSAIENIPEDIRQNKLFVPTN
jgi:hypothetical protein